MTRRSDLTRTYWFELLIAVMALAAMLELVVRRNSPAAPSTSLWLSVPAGGRLVLPLVLRRRFPFAAPAAFWLLAAALTFADGAVVPFVGSLGVIGLATAFLLGNLRDARKAGIGLMIVVGCILIVVANIPSAQSISDYVFISLRFVVSWVAGYALRERAEQAEAAEMRAVLAEREREAAEMRAALAEREREAAELRASFAEREREAAARVAVAEERSAIARELHDIVAHAMSVMVLQVGAVRHRLPQTDTENRQALGRVEQAGRTALAEMRRLLGAMRSNADGVALGPQPGLDSLDALLADLRGAGLPVQLQLEGDPLPLPRAIDLSAYRIVQEALTNTLKHAHASQADVTVRYAPHHVELEVRDDGEGAMSSGGAGHRLGGGGKHVKISGGERPGAAATDGGFLLTARLPVER